MKGVFLCQRRFAVIAHAIAVSLKNKKIVDEFCGLAVVRSSYEYLLNQTDLTYNTLLLDEDMVADAENEPLDLEYLKNLEREYGIPNLWPYLAVDRVIMHNQLVREYPYDQSRYSHTQMMRILQSSAKKIIAMFEKEKPDFVFMIAVGNMSSMLLYHIAKARGIKVLVGIIGRVGDLLLMSEHFADNTWANGLFRKIKNNEMVNPKITEAKQFLENFRNKPAPFHAASSVARQPVDRKKQFSFLKPKAVYRSIAWFLTMTARYARGKKHDYDEINPWHYIVDHIKRKARCLRGFNDLYGPPNPHEDYAFFPLHLDPEIATMLYAPFFTDQIYVIKQISRSLPIHYKLYIKEHPAMVGYRTRAYYQELKKIPNVRLIDPRTPSFGIIANAKIITTITSTVGWEATLMGKPVVTMGDVFFNALSFVKQCKTPEELPHIIKNQLEHFAYNEQELLDYLSALFADGISVPLVTMWEHEIDNLEQIKKYSEPIADLIAKKLNSLFHPV